MISIRRVAVALVVAALPASVHAQKRVLTQADWDKWRSINGAAISSDGRWAIYTLVPQVGDGELVIRATQNTTEYRVPRGFIGRPNNTPGGLRGPAGGTGEGDPTGPQVAAAQFTADNKYVLTTVQPTQADIERAAVRVAGRGGRGAAQAQRNSLAIVSLADGKVAMINGVRSFRVPRENGTWLAYVPEPDSASADSTNRGGAAGGRGGRGGAGGGGARRSYGSPLVLRNLATGAEERLTDVLAFVFDDSAKVLGYTVVSRDSTKDGAFLRNLGTGATSTLLSGRGDYKGLVFDRTASQFAFFSNRDEISQPKPRFTLYHGSLKGGSAQAVVTPNSVPAMRIADNGSVSFTRNGNALQFNLAPPSVDSVPADSLVGKAVFDLWHYKDPT
jgi:hypothetical protein